MIDQLDYCMLDNVVQPNIPFIRDSLKEVQDMGVGSLKNDSLMGIFMIPPPLSIAQVSYQDVQIASVHLDQNILLLEEYDPVALPILVVSSPNSLDLLDKILSSYETILEFINVWFHQPKDIFCGATKSILGLNPAKYQSILCMILDIIRYIWNHTYSFRLSLYEEAFETFATQTCCRV